MCLRLHAWPTKSTHYSFFPLPGISENKVQRSSYCILVVLTKWNHNHLEYFCLIILIKSHNRTYYGSFSNTTIMHSCTQWYSVSFCVHLSGGSRPTDKGGGGGWGHWDPEIRGEGGPKFFFTAFRGSVWCKNKGGGRAGPCPGSATTSNPLCRTKVRQTLKCFFCDKAILDDSQRDLSQLGSHSAYGSSWENTRSHSRWRWSSRWATVWITIWSYF